MNFGRFQTISIDRVQPNGRFDYQSFRAAVLEEMQSGEWVAPLNLIRIARTLGATGDSKEIGKKLTNAFNRSCTQTKRQRKPDVSGYVYTKA